MGRNMSAWALSSASTAPITRSKRRFAASLGVIDDRGTASVGPRVAPDEAGGGDIVISLPPFGITTNTIIKTNASAPATTHASQPGPPRSPPARAFARPAALPSARPQRVQKRSPTSDGASHCGHGGPRRAPPQREQKFASGDPSRCWQRGQATGAVVIR